MYEDGRINKYLLKNGENISYRYGKSSTRYLNGETLKEWSPAILRQTWHFFSPKLSSHSIFIKTLEKRGVIIDVLINFYFLKCSKYIEKVLVISHKKGLWNFDEYKGLGLAENEKKMYFWNDVCMSVSMIIWKQISLYLVFQLFN